MTEDTDANADGAANGDVIPAGRPIPLDDDGVNQNNILALVAQFSDRPDLLLETLEKHDPGFIKRMNEEVERAAQEELPSRNRFAKIQAYTSLGVSVTAALAVLGITTAMVVMGTAGFWNIIGMVIFYAVSQSGPGGFMRIVESIRNLLASRDKDD